MDKNFDARYVVIVGRRNGSECVSSWSMNQAARYPLLIIIVSIIFELRNIKSFISTTD